MAVTRRLIQERFNKATAFYTPEDNIINLINEHGGNFQQVTSEDELSNTITITLAVEQEEVALKDNSLILEDQIKRSKYCEDNTISFSVEES
jgi:hypothetical protein|tara:strand:- start:668 stop:943 length:276 start_codon:yes stop_codon:yes gene_type:complete